jgi:cathepsin L
LAEDRCATDDDTTFCSASETPEEVDAQSALVLSMTLSHAPKMHSFASFISLYGRTYTKGSEEYEMRHAIYKLRVHQIHRHNKHTKRRWNAGVNHLSDRTDAELAELRGLRAVKSGRVPGAVNAHPAALLNQIKTAIIPEEKSWTHLQAVKTNVDQSACGSCWAVATATALQANAEANGQNRTFSAQELLDCVPNPHHCGGDGGCKGSTVELAMNWVMEKGLATEEETPYFGLDSTCKKTSLLAHGGEEDDHYSDKTLNHMIAVGMHNAKTHSSAGLELGLLSWERLAENEYEPLLHAVATVGPTAVSVAASAWQSYDHGVFDGCGRDAVIDHAVTLVGYGKENGDKYWTIKNSWGNSWGEKGNIRLLRHEGKHHCGTDYQPEVGTACEGGPSQVHVCGMCGILYDSVVPHFQKRV